VGEAGKLYENSPVSVCLNKKAAMLSDLTLYVERYDSRKSAWLPYSDNRTALLLEAFNNPNDYYGFDELLYGMVVNDDCRGHSVLVKRRSESNLAVVGFWVLPYECVELRNDKDNADGTKLVTYVRYYTPGSTHQDIPVSDTIIIRNGIDPSDQRSGFSPLRAQLREVCTDNEASTRMATVMRNGPDGFILSPKNESQIAPDQIKMAADMVNEYVRDRAGKFIPFPIGLDVYPTSIKPSDMDLSVLRSIPTDRICAALGGDPMAFGLPSTSKTYSNLEEALDALGNHCIIPTANRWARQWSRQVLPDFRLDPKMFRLAWSHNGVSWLADEKYERNEDTRKTFVAGIIDRAQAKEQMGLTPSKDDVGVTYFDLQARSRGALPISEASTTKRMISANVERLKVAGRVPALFKRATKANPQQAAHDALVRNMENSFADAFRDYKNGNLTSDQLKVRLNRAVYDYHRDMYVLGGESVGVTFSDAQVRQFAQIAADGQGQFLLNFLQDVEDGRYDDENGELKLDGSLRTRSDLYATRASASASQGFIDGSPNSEFYWTFGDKDHCPDCIEFESFSPYDASTVFTNPRQGDSVCLGNCGCYWVRDDGLEGFRL
jgi:HK97 family phage portal protein